MLCINGNKDPLAMFPLLCAALRMMIEQSSLTAEPTIVPTVTLDFAAFAPGEAERITLTSKSYQRDMRRRGLLGQRVGHERFDLFGLAFLQATRTLAERGGPQLARHVAPHLAFGIAWAALAWVDAYSGDHDRVLSWDSTAAARLEAWQASTALLRKPDLTTAETLAEIDRIGPSEDGFNWAMQAGWLRREIFRRRGCKHVPQRYFCWWPDGSSGWYASVDGVFDAGVSTDSKFAGAVVVLDQPALAAQLIARCGRPFVHVQIGPAFSPRN